jgi:LysR family glycine cleavage system transcriptional activator
MHAAHSSFPVMKIRSPSLPELHAFVAVARLGSTVRAAQTLHVTQGTVSRAIQRLEEHLGCALFERHRRGAELNTAGHNYLASVAPAIDALEQAAHHLRKAASEERTLHISVIPSVANHWLIKRLRGFNTLHPEIELTFRPYQKDAPQNFEGIHATIRGGDAATQWDGIDKHYLIGESISPVCAVEWHERLTQVQLPHDFLQHPLLYHTSQPEAWRIWLQAMDCTPSHIPMHLGFDQVSQLLEAAASGLGIAMVQHCLAADHLERKRLIQAWPQQARNTRGYYLYHPKSLRNAPALEKFKAWLLAESAQTNQREASVQDDEALLPAST